MNRDEIVATVRAAWPEHAQAHGRRPAVLIDLAVDTALAAVADQLTAADRLAQLERNAAYILDQDNTASGHHAARYILGTGA